MCLDIKKLIPLIFLLFSACSSSRKNITQRINDEMIADYIRISLLYRNGEWKKTGELASELVEKYPDFIAAKVLAGKAVLFSGEPENAIKILGFAENNHENHEAGIWLIRAYNMVANYPAANKICEEMLARDSEDWRLLHLKSIERKQAGDHSGYKAFLNRSIDSISGAGFMFLERAKLKYSSGDISGAENDMNAAIMLFPDDSEAKKGAENILLEIQGRKPDKGNSK